MILIGMNKKTHGYGSAVLSFYRNGTPLPQKMRAPLLVEVERARAELERIEKAARESK